MDTGPTPVLLLIGVVYAWLAWNVVLLAVKRFRRFRLATLLVVVAIVSVALGVAAYVTQ